jgi:hypothetical protein
VAVFDAPLQPSLTIENVYVIDPEIVGFVNINGLLIFAGGMAVPDNTALTLVVDGFGQVTLLDEILDVKVILDRSPLQTDAGDAIVRIGLGLTKTSSTIDGPSQSFNEGVTVYLTWPCVIPVLVRMSVMHV